MVALHPGRALRPTQLVERVQNWYGDAISRIELGERWAASPHSISAFGDGAFQFGPLHLYLLGIASKLWSAREHAGRLVSLIAGVATTLPLWALSRRLFDARAARVSCLLLAFWGLHIQFSTTAASEALSLLLFTGCLAWFAAGRWALSGVALTLACATRYDVWMLIPVLAIVLALRRQYRDAAMFAGVALAFPIVWMIGNAQLHGEAQYPAHYINAFHRMWFAQNEAFWGVFRHRALNLFFWPLVAAFTLTPIVAIAGAARARHGWLIAVAVVPMIVLTTRSTIVGDFEPLARFTTEGADTPDICATNSNGRPADILPSGDKTGGCSTTDATLTSALLLLLMWVLQGRRRSL